MSEPVGAHTQIGDESALDVRAFGFESAMANSRDEKGRVKDHLVKALKRVGRSYPPIEPADYLVKFPPQQSALLTGVSALI